jgi:hypothetical protein
VITLIPYQPFSNIHDVHMHTVPPWSETRRLRDDVQGVLRGVGELRGGAGVLVETELVSADLIEMHPEDLCGLFGLHERSYTDITLKVCNPVPIVSTSPVCASIP